MIPGFVIPAPLPGVSTANIISKQKRMPPFARRTSRHRTSKPVMNSSPYSSHNTNEVSSHLQQADRSFLTKVERATTSQDTNTANQIFEQVLPPESRRRSDKFSEDEYENTTVVVARWNGRIVGAARFLFERTNVYIDRIAVLESHQGLGIGRKLLEHVLLLASPARGAIYLDAMPDQLGFFSYLGFAVQGSTRFDDGKRALIKTMVFEVPCQSPPPCILPVPGLHHTTIRVSNIETSLALYGALGFYVSEKFWSNQHRACFIEGFGTRIELYECPTDKENGTLDGVQGVPSTGYDRLVFDVSRATPDLSLFLDNMRKRNGGVLKIASEPATHVYGRHVVTSCAVEDPDGFPIEFMRAEATVPAQLVAEVDW
eukprot:CAMPEP_0184694478 /NCGR_PEP_ID=MMETSP0313-20130426/2421_1 /TAXON_ID=2792 /ORGANISM="Porphyridium aerugineum, Strain SAG 1380-2" /LENGTH=371 /DNA_ID=CAMNT_0027152773 /DNA_START=40 /DNA_END=1155 /DNA_ORIENTATION=-